MKNIFSILVIVFLFIFCFQMEDKTLANKEKEQVINSYDDADDDINEDKNSNEQKLKGDKNKSEKIVKTYPKVNKISYPSYYKKNGITLFLNNPTKFDYPSGEARVDACKLLINKINSAKNSIDFAIYGLEGQNGILNSIKNVKTRGVLIRGVADSDENNIPKYQDTEKLKQYADIKYDSKKSLMHNKFFIIDDNFLLTGSMNISNTGCGGYNSNSVVAIENPDIIKVFKNEFEQMFEGKFKREKTDFSTGLIQVGDNTSIKAVFSPVGKGQNVVLNEIKSAKSKIRVSAFIITYNNIINELIMAKARGVDVIVLLDAVAARNNKKQVKLLKDAGIKVKIENWGGKNHEKTISIDDNTLILGSANLTYSAYNVNDENIILIKDKDITTFYNGFFDALFNSIDDIYLEKFPKAEGLESGNSCFDKIDNDFDGKKDSEEYSCKK